MLEGQQEQLQTVTRLDESGGRVVAFIDIGTNSIHMLLARIDPDRSFSILNREKDMVRLGEGEFADHYLQPVATQRAVLVCRKFVEIARANGAETVVAIATTAIREARNKRAFLQLLKTEAGLDVRTISGREEARLIYLGVLSGVALGDRQALFIDIGGGSTEVIVGDQQGYQYLDSLKLGAVRLATLFFLPEEVGPVQPARYALIQRYVRNAAVRTLQQVRQYRLDLAIGSSGTIAALADIAARRFSRRQKERDGILTFSQLEGAIEILCSLSLAERRDVPGVGPERADTIVAGAVILHTIMQDLGLGAIRTSEHGLRDGLLVDYLLRDEHAGLVKGLSVRERSVLQLGRASGFDEPHARTVARLALELFDSARAGGLHELGATERELLAHAALLHDIGAFLSHTNHQAHTYYLIRNADLLGFNQAEINVIATVAFFHRKVYPNKKHSQFARLDKSTRGVVQTLAVLLQLAESLDRGHTGVIRQARLRTDLGKKAVLELHADGDCQLEVWGVHNNKKAFKKAFGRKLKLDVKVEEG